MSDRKVLMIGLDGATLDLILPWLEAGHLPHLARLFQEGSWGPLRSTVPAITAPAWTAALTGCQPGKTGIYDFFYRDPNTDALRVASALDVQVDRLWQQLNRYGKRVGMLFVPMTYPVSPLDGFMVSGLVTPTYADPRAAYPVDWLSRYRADVPALSMYMDAALAGNRFERLQELLLQHLREKGRIAHEAIVREPWDFFMVQFQETDYASHGFWRFLDQSRSSYRDAILRVYQAADEQIGRLLEAVAGRPCTVMMMSDHGFGPSQGLINLPRILEGLGLLTLRRPTFDQMASSWFKRARGKVTRASIQRVIDLVGRVTERGYRGSPTVVRGWADQLAVALANLLPAHLWSRAMPHYFTLIDWSQTKAYAVGIQGLFVNRRDTYRSGIVSAQEYERVRQVLLEGFQGLQSADGLAVAPSPKRKEELYRGPALQRAPDVIPFPDQQGYGLSYEYRRSEPLLSPTPSFSGTHRPEGVFAIAGEGILRGRRLASHDIVDIAPTIYTLMDVPVPSGLDGRVIDACFEHRQILLQER